MCAIKCCLFFVTSKDYYSIVPRNTSILLAQTGKAFMAIERLYSVEEAAKALRISYWTVWAKLKDGTLLRTKVGGRTVIRESELQKLIVDKPRKDAKK